ncbi:hypothetical protein C8Q75DRAFT_737075 [Abortiporus biennis]|nr:hypothetical protein C8Q75DRAFT_737075 [Abortiporus biennis]
MPPTRHYKIITQKGRGRRSRLDGGAGALYECDMKILDDEKKQRSSEMKTKHITSCSRKKRSRETDTSDPDDPSDHDDVPRARHNDWDDGEDSQPSTSGTRRKRDTMPSRGTRQSTPPSRLNRTNDATSMTQTSAPPVTSNTDTQRPTAISNIDNSDPRGRRPLPSFTRSRVDPDPNSRQGLAAMDPSSSSSPPKDSHAPTVETHPLPRSTSNSTPPKQLEPHSSKDGRHPSPSSTDTTPSSVTLQDPLTTFFEQLPRPLGDKLFIFHKLGFTAMEDLEMLLQLEDKDLCGVQARLDEEGVPLCQWLHFKQGLKKYFVTSQAG